MRPVARAEPATKVPGVAQWNATKVRADADQHEPLLLQAPVVVRLRVPELADVDVVRLRNLVRGPVLDEHWLSSPLHGHRAPLLDPAEVHLEGSQGQDVLTGLHGQNKLEDEEPQPRGVDEPPSRQDKVCERSLARVTGKPLVSTAVVVRDAFRRVLQRKVCGRHARLIRVRDHVVRARRSGHRKRTLHPLLTTEAAKAETKSSSP
mmetsp:Transcript_14476/g.41194  ORF Transcript_14476/g.41194 Transcript_14476/m.41194 type:complete len:206 (-) Transcript_14476:280-897(-)